MDYEKEIEDLKARVDALEAPGKAAAEDFEAKKQQKTAGAGNYILSPLVVTPPCHPWLSPLVVTLTSRWSLAHNVIMMVFLTHPPLLPAKACTLRPPCAAVAMARGSSASGETMPNRLNLVKSSQIEDPAKGHNFLEPCGKATLNPLLRLHAPKAPVLGHLPSAAWPEETYNKHRGRPLRHGSDRLQRGRACPSIRRKPWKARSCLGRRGRVPFVPLLFILFILPIPPSHPQQRSFSPPENAGIAPVSGFFTITASSRVVQQEKQNCGDQEALYDPAVGRVHLPMVDLPVTAGIAHYGMKSQQVLTAVPRWGAQLCDGRPVLT